MASDGSAPLLLPACMHASPLRLCLGCLAHLSPIGLLTHDVYASMAALHRTRAALPPPAAANQLSPACQTILSVGVEFM